MDNMKLWDQVSITDPAHVKPITGKTYSGNSPKPYWLIEQATKTFGPCGIGWGVEVISEVYTKAGDFDILHSAIVRVWYVWHGQRGHVEQAGGTKAAYKSNSGKMVVDEDAAKKSVTDGMVKCLSMIGFCADIFSGRWDDSKYVEFARQYHDEIKADEAAEQAKAEYQKATEEAQLLIEAFEDAPTLNHLGELWKGMGTHFVQWPDLQGQLTEAKDERKAELMKLEQTAGKASTK